MSNWRFSSSSSSRIEWRQRFIQFILPQISLLFDIKIRMKNCRCDCRQFLLLLLLIIKCLFHLSWEKEEEKLGKYSFRLIPIRFVRSKKWMCVCWPVEAAAASLTLSSFTYSDNYHWREDRKKEKRSSLSHTQSRVHFFFKRFCWSTPFFLFSFERKKKVPTSKTNDR